MQTLSVILSLICRIALIGLVAPALVTHFSVLPGHPTQAWIALAACYVLAVVAPMIQSRNPALVAGLLTLGVYYWLHHSFETWTLIYTGIAIVLVLLPRYRRKPVK